MRTLTPVQVAEALAAATRRPHMAVTVTGTPDASSVLTCLPDDANESISRHGHAIIALDAFVEAALFFCRVEDELARRPLGPCAYDVVLVQDNGTHRQASLPALVLKAVRMAA